MLSGGGGGDKGSGDEQCQLSKASPTKDSIAVHGWQALLVRKSSDEMYGRIPWGFLLSMYIPAVH